MKSPISAPPKSKIALKLLFPMISLSILSISSSGSAAVATLLPYNTYANTYLGFNYNNTIFNSDGPVSSTYQVDTPNPYYGNLGEASGFGNSVGASARLSPDGRAFAYGGAFSVSPYAGAGGNIRYFFEVESELDTTVSVDIKSMISLLIGYQGLGLDTDPTIYYGYYGQEVSSDVVIYIASLDNLTPSQTYVKSCGMNDISCNSGNGVMFEWDNKYLAQTNSIYQIVLSAGGYAKGPAPIGHTFILNFASAYIDPYFSIDDSVPNPDDFALKFSPGIQNVPFTTPVPEPATWAMMLLGFGLVGFAMRRRLAMRW